MSEADGVISTPRTRALARDLSRRTALAGLAVLPATLPAAAEAAADPISAAIERHRAAVVIYEAVVYARATFDDIDVETDEQRTELDRLDAAVEETCRPCKQAGVNLINTEPTALAGVIADRGNPVHPDPDGEGRRHVHA